jgi:hypothetical protein
VHETSVRFKPLLNERGIVHLYFASLCYMINVFGICNGRSVSQMNTDMFLLSWLQHITISSFIIGFRLPLRSSSRDLVAFVFLCLWSFLCIALRIIACLFDSFCLAIVLSILLIIPLVSLNVQPNYFFFAICLFLRKGIHM